jgi:hypothetical protein
VAGSAVVKRVPYLLQQHVVNPIVKLGWELRIPIPGDALLETTGRRTGQRRRTPVCDGLVGDTFWLVAQRILGQASLARWLCVCTSKAVSTNPLTVRVDLDAH